MVQNPRPARLPEFMARLNLVQTSARGLASSIGGTRVQVSRRPETCASNVSFKLCPGQLYIIVGSNGAGKSMILKLAVRL
ncbi:hypothetical protein LXA43DRAFT_703222 [Ganoderma leucocontextum]|nr:hypothetical protein LXA43DRAFT_703222 [Ganoderma leucocontextum]